MPSTATKICQALWKQMPAGDTQNEVTDFKGKLLEQSTCRLAHDAACQSAILSRDRLSAFLLSRPFRVAFVGRALKAAVALATGRGAYRWPSAPTPTIAVCPVASVTMFNLSKMARNNPDQEDHQSRGYPTCRRTVSCGEM